MARPRDALGLDIPAESPGLAPRLLRFGPLGLLLVLLSYCPAVAYEESGHYYTVAAAMKSLLPPRVAEQDSSLVAFCAQLPDETYELDALQVYRALPWGSWGGWVLRGADTDPAVGRMVAVQQLLHGLTGGMADSLQTVAREIVHDLAATALAGGSSTPSTHSTTLCALGFALHLYGDSFAHVRLSAADKMYPTGRGHADDFSKPDYPLYEPDGARTRATAWATYMRAFPRVLGPFTLDAQLDKQQIGQVFDLPSSWRKVNLLNQYGEAHIREILLGRIGPRLPTLRKPLEAHGNEPCEGYMNQIFSGRFFGSLPRPTCRAVWDLFRSRALPVFNKYPASRDAQFRNLRLEDPVF